MINKEKFVIEAMNALCSSLDLTVSLDRLRCFVATVMPVELILVTIFQQSLKSVKLVALAAESGAELIDYVIPVDDETVQFIEVVDKQEIRVIDDLEHDQDLGPIIRFARESEFPLAGFFGDGKISVIGVPLTIGGKWIGQCGIMSGGVGNYSQPEADLLEPLQELLALVLVNCLQYNEITRLQDILADENRYLQQELREVSGDVIGRNFGLKKVMDLVLQTASKDNPVLLYGETGTGKEVIANAIHYSSSRKKGPFIKVNCGAIPENLIDSELFGHEKGAFTGALDRKKGRFERANNGTIFLDEIGELPLAVQVRLLRVLQNREIERVGGSETIPLNIRIIAATHRDLIKMTTDGSFREDLFYRINVFPILIPPLRQRKVDIPELIEFFIDRKAKELKLKQLPELVPGTMVALMKYNWPGNVRELENVVERALIRYQGDSLSLDDFLAPKIQESPEVDPKVQIPQEVLPMEEMTRLHIQTALSQTEGRISGAKGAAELLKMHPNTLRSKMKKLGMTFNRDK